MTDCLPILFYNSPSVSRGVQRLIILLFCSNGKCPSSAPLINKLNLKVAQHSTAERRNKDIHAPPSCASERTRRCICRHTKRRGFLLLVIEHFHTAVLLNPKLTDDDVVHTTGGVCPGVGLIISASTKMQQGLAISTLRWCTPWKESNQTCSAASGPITYLGSSSVMSPLGSASMLFPQNLSLG